MKKIGIWTHRLLIVGLLLVNHNSCINKVSSTVQQSSYPIDSVVLTTLERTILPDSVPSASPEIHPWEISKFPQYGYGKWSYGAGLAYDKRLDLMPKSYPTASVTNNSKLLSFFAMTDIHITDKESPNEAVFFGMPPFNIISAYSPIMLYTTQVLDASIQTINALHKKKNFDFGIALGDMANCTQYNELRWFIDVLDGKKINPDSGIKDDPIAGPNNDYQDEYMAAGLDKSIPWYATIGNHDHFWIGTNPMNDAMRRKFIGKDILKMGNIFKPGGFKDSTYYVGVMDGKTIYGDIIGAGPVADIPNPITVSEDPNRRSLLRSEWMKECLNTSSDPVGHGFNQTNVTSDFACYSFDPKSDLPLKVIVLDNTQNENDEDIHGYGHGTLDNKRYDWLIEQLDNGQKEGKLMIIAAHIPIGVEPEGSFIGWYAKAVVTEKELIAKLNTYPNLILWIAGHRHLNTVTALKSPDPNRPELGFWEVETSSLREFPQQFRTFEIVRNSDNTISIFATNVDPAVKPGSFAELSRNYAIAASQVFKLKHTLLPTGSVSYNVELVKPLSAEMQTKIKNLGTPVSK